MFVLMYQPIEKMVFNRIENRMIQTNQTLQKNNQQKIKEIEKQADAYPEYYKYQNAAQQVDTFTQQQLADLSHSDLIYFSDSLYTFFDENDVDDFPKDKFIKEIDEIINSSNDDFYNTLKINQILFKQTSLFNYFIEKSRGTRISCWFGPDFVFFDTKGSFWLNEPTTVNFGLAGFSRALPKNHQIWVNEKQLLTKDGKSHFKHKTTRSGWHEMRVKITAEYAGIPIKEEIVYPYYVCP